MPSESIIPFFIRVVDIGNPFLSLRSLTISALSGSRPLEFLSLLRESKRWEFSDVRTMISISLIELAGPK